MIIERMKMRKFKEILLIDCENVGYQIPLKLPKHTYIYLFVSDSFVIEKLKQNISDFQNQVEIVDICHLIKKHSSKNAMDFCIVSKLAQIIKHISKKQKIVIISKDKGYDVAIEFIKSEYNRQIKRYALPVACYFHTDIHVAKILSQLDEKTLKLISQYHSMFGLKRVLTKKQKKIFVFDQFTESISNIKIFIEYDIYDQCFSLYYSGNVKKRYQTLQEAKYDFNTLVQETKQKYEKYYSNELLRKAKKLNIHPYIEEAYLKNKPLQECLINHFGIKEGEQLFQSFIN